jgi:two-component system NtrC family response regulator
MEMAIAALQAGAADFILKPFRMQQMFASIQLALSQQKIERENRVLKRQVDQIYDSGMIGKCDAMMDICEVLQRVAPMPTTVLLEGESGTGKELAARALHRWSKRKGSFVPINCGAISAELMESELFGHTKGAFTGAQQTREGLFTYADGGTLFLDEIGEMPLSMQVHLLRVLEEKVIRPVGSNREIPVDVRVIAATNRNLSKEVEQGKFREDLYYRINVISIRMPALRERMEDLPVLVQHFATTIAKELGVPLPGITEDDLTSLRAYDWPGNIRELKNIVERCLLLKKNPMQCIDPQAFTSSSTASNSEVSGQRLEDVEKQHILNILDAEKGNKSAAARRLGVSRKTLERKVRRWNEDQSI